MGDKKREQQVRERVAAWLNYKMRRHRLTIAATAQLMGVSAAAVSRVKSGDRDPGLDFVVAMSKGLVIPLDVMIDTDPPVQIENGLSTDLRRKSE